MASPGVEARWQLELGARVEPGGVRFAVWAPRATRLEVLLPGPPLRIVALERGEGGVFVGRVPGVGAGADYSFVIDGGPPRADPVSRWQPQGVHGPSRVVDPRAFAWDDAGWSGLPLAQYVLYELHVGTFTGEGTFEAAIGKLAHLQALGVTAIELMPVAEFPGARNWGYDGVCLYAPHSRYGGPEGLRRLVAACHRHGLAVVLDVVHNHLGPEGNQLAAFGPYFSQRHQTPWGDALNFDGVDGAGVRRHVVDNARFWLDEYHLDALRLDAVQHLVDDSPRHVVEDLVRAVEAHAAHSGRPAFAIAESNRNEVRLIQPAGEGGQGVHAQWNDDFHHALYAALTGERRGHCQDFGPLADVQTALTQGFVNDGRHSGYRGRRHGTSSSGRPGEQLVYFIQNHDQVANGSGGARLSTLLSLEEQKLAAALLCCAPGLLLFFMGQEWGETAPFHYFTSHGDPALALAVSEGRRRQLQGLGLSGTPPDPQQETTFAACKLRWEFNERPHQQLLRLTGELLSLRRGTPALANCRKDLTRVDVDEQQRWLRVVRRDPGTPSVLGLFNFRREAAAVPLPSEGTPLRLALSTAEERYGGPGGAPLQLLPGPRVLLLPASSASLYLEGS